MKILCVWGRHNYGNAARGESYEHANFIPALEALGHSVVFFDSWDRDLHADFAQLNLALVQRVREEAPDLVIMVLLGYEIWLETLDLLRHCLGVRVVNWGTDDSWKYEQFSRHIARHVDCYATTSQSAFENAVRDGHRNWVSTQWAASDARLAAPIPASQCRHGITFVGTAYGNRRQWVESLRRSGLEVECFGHGWPGGSVTAEQVDTIIRGSKVSLNFADSGLHLKGLVPYRSRQLKARVFEVPGCGGMLLTQDVEGLDRWYVEGREVAVFRNAGELADKARYYLENALERDRMADAGYARSRAEHTYTLRFSSLIDHVMQLPGPVVSSASPASLEHAVAAHRAGSGLRLLRALTAGPASLVFGRRRGARAARRLLFELSWRLCGAHTYRSAGWAGRLFYRES